jgi:hypothetical protein
VKQKNIVSLKSTICSVNCCSPEGATNSKTWHFLEASLNEFEYGFGKFAIAMKNLREKLIHSLLNPNLSYKSKPEFKPKFFSKFVASLFLQAK